MLKKQKNILALFFLCSIFFIGGCASLRQIDSEIGRFLTGEKSEEPDTEIITEGMDTSGFSREQKERIDLWLETNGYNRYGDLKNTYYPGGTPLFDESTGESKERYEYILEKHPDILSKI